MVSAVPDIMLRCPACGVEPAVFVWDQQRRAYCDHCNSIVSLVEISRYNPSVAFPYLPEPDCFIDGAVDRSPTRP